MRLMTFPSFCLTAPLFFGVYLIFGSAFASAEADPKFTLSDLQSCHNASCFVELAKKEAKDYNGRFTKHLPKTYIARSLLYLGQDSEAIDILDEISSSRTPANFFYAFGWWAEGYVDQFPADGQLWTKFSPPLPESLIGRYYFFDMLFAYNAIEKKNFEVANDIAENLDDPVFRNAIYYLLAVKLIDEDRVKDALASLVKIQQFENQQSAPSLPLIEIFRKATEQQISVGGPYAADKILDENARAGIAVATAESGNIDDALQKLAAIKDPEIRVGGFGYLLYMLAKQGEIDTVKELLDSHAGRNLTAGQYKYVVNGFLRSNDVTNAEELISLPSTDDKAIFTLSALGAHTGDETYLALLRFVE